MSISGGKLAEMEKLVLDKLEASNPENVINGIFDSTYCQEIGCTQSMFQVITRMNRIQCIGKNYYMRMDNTLSDMEKYTIVFERVVATGLYALYLREFINKEPQYIDISCRRSEMKTSTARYPRVIAHTLNDFMYDAFTSDMITKNGVVIRVRNVERAICDMVAYDMKERQKENIRTALGVYGERYKGDFSKIIACAKELEMSSKLLKRLGETVRD